MSRALAGCHVDSSGVRLVSALAGLKSGLSWSEAVSEADMTQSSDLTMVRTFSFPHEAHLACSALEAAGIQASVVDEHIVAADWLYSNAVGGVKVLVPVEDAATALAVLDTPAEVDVSADGAERDATRIADAVVCPRCGSHNVARVTPGRRLLFLTWLLLGLPVFPVLRRTRCGGCGHVFKAAWLTSGYSRLPRRS
jgi:hypothetical protein